MIEVGIIIVIFATVIVFTIDSIRKKNEEKKINPKKDSKMENAMSKMEELKKTMDDVIKGKYKEKK